jgi:SpoVK/Ycf46/Vps4 family AAA+-type ATPase
MNLEDMDFVKKVIPRFRFDELILPPKQQRQFEEIIETMKMRTKVYDDWKLSEVWNESGITCLFAGPSGTGKTMAAEIIARELKLPMYRIELSQVVSKYIGETEKNLKQLFEKAEISDTILFFDEADALFGRRTEIRDAHDRYANITVSYLLERMERFKGLVILAANKKENLDDAFIRRIRFLIDFPMPSFNERKKIWKKAMPKGVDHSEVDITFLAKQFPISGGNIRSIVFNACFQSIADPKLRDKLSMEELIKAVKHEYDKMNHSINLDQFGPYSQIVKELTKRERN